jgi:hypothetical protein
MAFVDYWNELIGAVPKLPVGMAQRAVNRAWKDIRNKRLWTFKMLEDDFVSPNPVTAGTVAVTFGSTFVNADAVATLALNNFGLFPPVTSCQIRIGTYDPFNIAVFNSLSGVIQLDRAYSGPTAAAASYMVFRCYYTAPRDQFQRWWTVKDTTNGYWLRLNTVREELDARDPQRQAVGNAYHIASYKIDPGSNRPQFEFWPWPINPIVYNAMGIYDPPDFTNPSDSLPLQVSEVTLMERARYYGYEWAEANKGRFPELRSTSWSFLMGAARERAVESCRDDERQDEELFTQNFIQPHDTAMFLGPIDARYAQSHDVNW